MASEDRERWDRRYVEGSHIKEAAPDWVGALGDEIPRQGRALDVASGTGRVARWLARRGLRVTALDISPVGLELCHRAALAEGLDLETLELDLEQRPLPAGSYAVVSCFHYLQRDLFPALRDRLAPGGVLLCETPTRLNLKRHAHPSARFLLDTNELLALCAPLEVVYYREGWIDDHSLARILARKLARETHAFP